MPTLSCYSNKNIKNDVQIATVHYQPFPGLGDCGTENGQRCSVYWRTELSRSSRCLVLSPERKMCPNCESQTAWVKRDSGVPPEFSYFFITCMLNIWTKFPFLCKTNCWKYWPFSKFLQSHDSRGENQLTDCIRPCRFFSLQYPCGQSKMFLFLRQLWEPCYPKEKKLNSS